MKTPHSSAKILPCPHAYRAPGLVNSVTALATRALVLLVLSAPMATQAAVVRGSFSGTLFSGFDSGPGPGGYFGAGGDLADLPITGTFRYDTTRVPAASQSGSNFATYSDPGFSTDFLAFSLTINGRTYRYGNFAAAPGIQVIDLIDDTDQLQFDYQRFGNSDDEALSLRFISAIDFLSGTGVPENFDFTAGGVGLNPVGTFSFSLVNGDSASGSFTIDRSSARVQPVPETPVLPLVALGLAAVATTSRRRVSGGPA